MKERQHLPSGLGLGLGLGLALGLGLGSLVEERQNLVFLPNELRDLHLV